MNMFLGSLNKPFFSFFKGSAQHIFKEIADVSKRDGSRNFTKEELFLAKLCLKYKGIVKCKKSRKI